VDGIVHGSGIVGRKISEFAGLLDIKIVDAIVDLVGHAGRLISIGLDIFDLKVVDGAVNGVGTVVKVPGGYLRKFQGGKVQSYLLLAATATLAVAGVFVFVIIFLPF
jgi:NADH-quinone oxidoreductase subunit L